MVTGPGSGYWYYKQALAFQKSWGRLALLLYVFLHTACLLFALIELVRVLLFQVLIINVRAYTMHNKFSNCFVWVSPSTLDFKFHLL